MNGKHNVCLCFQLLEVVLCFATSWHEHQVRAKTKRNRNKEKQKKEKKEDVRNDKFEERITREKEERSKRFSARSDGDHRQVCVVRTAGCSLGMRVHPET